MNVQTNDLTFSEFTEEVLILLYGNEWYKKTLIEKQSPLEITTKQIKDFIRK